MQVPHSAAVTVGANTHVRRHFVTREPKFLEEENLQLSPNNRHITKAARESVRSYLLGVCTFISPLCTSVCSLRLLRVFNDPIIAM
jgi:hypothetical protein